MSRNPETAPTVQEELNRQLAYEETAGQLALASVEGMRFSARALRNRVRYAEDSDQSFTGGSVVISGYWARYIALCLERGADAINENGDHE